MSTVPQHPQPLPEIKEGSAFDQRGFKVWLTVPAGLAGLFVVVIAPHLVAYVGPFVGICGVYENWGPLMRLAHNLGAKFLDFERRGKGS